MSKTSDIFDGMITRLTALYPIPTPYQRLSNPYKIEENPGPFLRQGWGIGFGPAVNTNRQIGCNLSLRRDLVITLTREYFSLEEDPAAKATTEKLILEDQFLLIKDFENNPVVNSTSFKTIYVSDNGIEYVYQGKDVFLMVQTTFSTEYLENLT